MINSLGVALCEIDEIQFRLSCGVAALGAVHTAMVEGPFGSGGYGDALFCVYDYLTNVNQELQTAVDIAFKE